jgi:hypothetical protein
MKNRVARGFTAVAVAAAVVALVVVAWAPAQSQQYWSTGQRSGQGGYHPSYPSAGGYYPGTGTSWYYDYYGTTPPPRIEQRQSGYAGLQAGQATGQGVQQLHGEVVRTKRVETARTPCLAVLLQTDDGRRVVVDLGPAQDLRNEDINIRSGSDLRVRGRYTTVGEYRVFMAHEVRSDGQWVEVSRRAQPSEQQFREEERMRARGGREDEDRASARRTQRGGEEESAEEPERGGREANWQIDGMSFRQLNGEIRRMHEIRLPEFKEAFLVALMRTDQGRKALAVLGPADELQDLDLRDGDHVAVQGLCLTVDGHPVCLTQQLRAHGQTLQAAQRSQEEMVRRSQQVRGKVVRTKDIDLPGINQDVTVAVLQGDDGQKYITCLGTTEELKDVEVNRGDQLTVRGPEFRIGEHRFVLAREVNARGHTVHIGESDRGSHD